MAQEIEQCLENSVLSSWSLQFKGKERVRIIYKCGSFHNGEMKDIECI
jgi:hypothetical protein